MVCGTIFTIACGGKWSSVITLDTNITSNDVISVCEEGPGICALIMTIGSLLLIVVSLPLSLLFVVKVVQEYERAVIFRLGRLLTGGARGPGVFFIIPCVDIYEKIDLRTATYEIPPQEVTFTPNVELGCWDAIYIQQILTKDSVTVFVNAIMYYKVANATHAVSNVDDYSGSARLLAATTLRNVLGTLTLGEILSQRESIAKDMRVSLERSLTFSLIFFYEFSKILMLQRSPGELRWRGWRWRTSGSQSSSREPWLLRLRLPERPELKWSLLRENTRPAELSDRLQRSSWTARQLYSSDISRPSTASPQRTTAPSCSLSPSTSCQHSWQARQILTWCRLSSYTTFNNNNNNNKVINSNQHREREKFLFRWASRRLIDTSGTRWCPLLQSMSSCK